MSEGGEPFFEAECETKTMSLCFCYGEEGGDFFGGHEPVVLLLKPLDKFLLCL